MSEALCNFCGEKLGFTHICANVAVPNELQTILDERDRLRAALQAFCDEVEMDAAAMAYKCGLGAGEWEAFIDRAKLYKQYRAGKAALTPGGVVVAGKGLYQGKGEAT